MGRPSTKTAVNEGVEKNTTPSDVDTAEKNEEKNEEKNDKKKVVEETKPAKKAPKPLDDSDEIEVESIIPNVSYKDSKTGDMYEWDEIGHIEYMTFDTLKNMWRNHKGYFRNMWLKPKDDRVINKFGLTKTFEKYDYIMDDKNYSIDKIDEVCDSILEAPNGLKYSVYNKIKDSVINGEITNVKVVRTLEKRLGLDLIDFL